MTIYTIVFNGYGVFLPEWIKSARQFDEIIVVLGKNHGVKEREDGVTYIESKSDTMGTLRNLAIDKVKTEWMLYFSVDDYLYPNAYEELKKYMNDYEVIGLTFMDGKEEKRSALFTANSVKLWRSTVIPGYIAIKGRYKYKDIEIPNYPYLFKIAGKRLKKCHTERVIAEYKRRPNSHGDISAKTNRFEIFAKEIDKYAKQYFDKYADKEAKANEDYYMAKGDIKGDDGVKVKKGDKVYLLDPFRINYLMKTKLIEGIEEK